MVPTVIPQNLISAYMKTDFIVMQENKHFVIHINEHSKKLDALHRQYDAQSSTFITAYNPRSEPCTDEKNIAKQYDLEIALNKIKCVIILGLGQDAGRAWPSEPNFLAIGLSEDEARHLGIQYEQNAIVFSNEDAIPRLMLLR